MYGKTCDKCKGINHFKVVCHSKVTAAKTVPSPHRSKKSQLPQRCASTGSNSGHSKGGGRHHQKKKMPKKPPKQKASEVIFKNLVLSQVTTTSGGERERMVMYHIRRQSYQDQMKKVCTTGVLALLFIAKWLKALTLRLQRAYTQILTQTIGLRS